MTHFMVLVKVMNINMVMGKVPIRYFLLPTSDARYKMWLLLRQIGKMGHWYQQSSVHE